MSWQSAAQFIPLVINLALTPTIIHGLGPARYSIFLLVSTFTAVLSQFDGGIGPSVMRFFTLYAAREDRVETTRLLVSVSLVVVAISALLITVAITFSGDVLAFFRVADGFLPEATFLFQVLIAIIGLILVRNVVNAVVNARQLFRYTAVAMLVGYGVYITGLLLTIHQGWGLRGVAWTMLVQQLVGSAISVPPGLALLDRRGVGLISRRQAREFVSYAAKVQVTSVANLLNSQKDQLVAGRVISAQESGPYGQGVNVATQLRMMPMNASFPMMAMIGSEVGARGPAEAVPKVERLQRVWVRAVTGWCLVGAVAAFFGVRAWLPDSFAIAAPVAAIVLAGGAFTLMLQVAKLWALTLGAAGVEMRFGMVTLVANAGLSVLLGVPFGMLGVVVATALSQVVGALYFSWEMRRSVPTRPRWFVREVPWLPALVGVSACAGCELLLAPHAPRGAWGLLACGAAGAPAYALYGLLAFGPSGLRDLRGLVRRG